MKKKKKSTKSKKTNERVRVFSYDERAFERREICPYCGSEVEIDPTTRSQVCGNCLARLN